MNLMMYPRNISARFLCLLLVTAMAIPLVGHAETHEAETITDKPFSSMAITPDKVDECRVPRPPAELAETAYLRNGYRAILRILIAEHWAKHWQETGDCTCLLGQFTWDMALDNLERFQTSDNPRLPFKVLDLYAIADALEAERVEMCRQ